MKKDKARSRAKLQKEMLTAAERNSAAANVFEQLEHLAAFLMSEHILMYHSLPDEIDTHIFIDKWHQLKKFFLPRVNGINLDILPYNRSTLKHGAFHIEEPQGDDIVSADIIDLIVVPGMAFDASGNRVGRGRGYYDRLLSSSKAIKIGVAYDCQLVDEIETEPHDIPVDILITEKRTYFPKHKFHDHS